MRPGCGSLAFSGASRSRIYRVMRRIKVKATMLRSRPLRVFLSYKHIEARDGADEYTQSVAALVLALRLRGIRVFMDKDLFGADRWQEVLKEEMLRADV